MWNKYPSLHSYCCHIPICVQPDSWLSKYTTHSGLLSRVQLHYKVTPSLSHSLTQLYKYSYPPPCVQSSCSHFMTGDWTDSLLGLLALRHQWAPGLILLWDAEMENNTRDAEMSQCVFHLFSTYTPHYTLTKPPLHYCPIVLLNQAYKVPHFNIRSQMKKTCCTERCPMRHALSAFHTEFQMCGQAFETTRISKHPIRN